MNASAEAARIALLEESMRGKEDEHLEFKEWKTRDDFELLCKYCCALAKTLKQRGKASLVGRTNAGRWFPGSSSPSTAD